MTVRYVLIAALSIALASCSESVETSLTFVRHRESDSIFQIVVGSTSAMKMDVESAKSEIPTVLPYENYAECETASGSNEWEKGKPFLGSYRSAEVLAIESGQTKLLAMRYQLPFAYSPGARCRMVLRDDGGVEIRSDTFVPLAAATANTIKVRSHLRKANFEDEKPENLSAPHSAWA